MAEELADREQTARALTGIGDARHEAGQPERAVEAWRRALALYAELDVPEADEVRRRVAGALGRRALSG